MPNRLERQQNRGCVLFIIPKADDYLDPVCDRLFDCGFAPVLLHHGETIDNHQERLDSITRDFGDIVCAVHPDDLDFCDDWCRSQSSKVRGSIYDLLNILQKGNTPIVPIAMEWGGPFDDRVEVEDATAAVRNILVVVNSIVDEGARDASK